jgi:hypothetical protein
VSRIVEWFRERLLGPRAPVGGLDRERVLEIARAAAAGYRGAAELSMTNLEARGSAKIWFVRTPTVGQVLTVQIDDANAPWRSPAPLPPQIPGRRSCHGHPMI